MFSFLKNCFLAPPIDEQPDNAAVRREAAQLVAAAIAGHDFIVSSIHDNASEANQAILRLQTMMASRPQAPTHVANNGEAAVHQVDHGLRHYHTDVLFLKNTAKQLYRSGVFQEEFVFVTGPRVSKNAYVLAQTLEVVYDNQSAGGVDVNMVSSALALEHLANHALFLIAHVHTHPGSGHQATFASAKDKAFLARLDKLGHIAIGLIFDRDCKYVRFYGPRMEQCQIHISGKLEEVEQDVYCLAD